MSDEKKGVRDARPAKGQGTAITTSASPLRKILIIPLYLLFLTSLLILLPIQTLAANLPPQLLYVILYLRHPINLLLRTLASALLPLVGITFLTTTGPNRCTTNGIDGLQGALSWNAWITSLSSYPAGSTYPVPSWNIGWPTSPTNLPAFCAVTVTVQGSPLSTYQYSIFLPETEAWNGRFLAVGNGGFGGGINYLDMGAGLKGGFATISTDTGHISAMGDVTWAGGHGRTREDKLRFWGWEAMHGSVMSAKRVTEYYYEKAIKKSYYSGCSTGGRQGLKEAQMWPESFDGVLAGAPAWWTTHMQPWSVKVGMYNVPGSEGYVEPRLFAGIAKVVHEFCDKEDGLVDDLVSDPSRCPITYEVFRKSDVELSEAQYQTLQNVWSWYMGPEGELGFPGILPGSEAIMPFLLGGPEPSSYGTQFVQYMLLNDPTWDWRTFNFSVIEFADVVNPGKANADQYDMSPFKGRGGKVIMYHGLADALIPANSSTVFWDKLHETMGPDQSDWYKLYMMPGMQHCAGCYGNAPWVFGGSGQGAGGWSVPGFEDAKHDALLALVQWVEEGKAPDALVATKFVDDNPTKGVARQRPICVYPKVAKYVGGDGGSIDNPEAFKCVDWEG